MRVSSRQQRHRHDPAWLSRRKLNAEWDAGQHAARRRAPMSPSNSSMSMATISASINAPDLDVLLQGVSVMGLPDFFSASPSLVALAFRYRASLLLHRFWPPIDRRCVFGRTRSRIDPDSMDQCGGFYRAILSPVPAGALFGKLMNDSASVTNTNYMTEKSSGRMLDRTYSRWCWPARLLTYGGVGGLFVAFFVPRTDGLGAVPHRQYSARIDARGHRARHPSTPQCRPCRHAGHSGC